MTETGGAAAGMATGQDAADAPAAVQRLLRGIQLARPADLYPGATHVAAAGLARATDAEVWAYGAARRSAHSRRDGTRRVRPAAVYDPKPVPRERL